MSENAPGHKIIQSDLMVESLPSEALQILTSFRPAAPKEGDLSPIL